MLRLDPRTLIERRFIGKGGNRNVGDGLALELQDKALRVGRDADDGEVQFPLAEDLLGFRLAARLEHHEHALLAFRQHHLVRRHALLAARHLVEVEFDARATLVRHFAGRGGEPGRTHVLDADDGVRRHEFEAGFEQQLFGERITDLDGGALFLGGIVELGRGHRGPVNAVAARLGSDIDNRIARTLRGRQEDLVGLGETHAHRVDEYVAVIGLVEVHFAGDRWYAHAIAIAANARNDSRHKVLRLGMLRLAKA